MSGAVSRKSVFVAVFLVLAPSCAGVAGTAAAPESAYADSSSLVACSATKATQAKALKASKAKKAFAGKWKLCKMEQNGKVTGKNDLKALKKLGLEVTFNLKKNGSPCLKKARSSISSGKSSNMSASGTGCVRLAASRYRVYRA